MEATNKVTEEPQPPQASEKKKKVGNVLGDYENFGWDTDMCPYKTIDDMWKTELGDDNVSQVKNPTQGKKQWYNKAREYWKTIENNYNGVLGGLNHINGLDIVDSRKHIDQLIAKHKMGTKRCLDCGSGVGRITKELHGTIFEKVDLLEPDKGFMDQARV